MPKSKRKFTQWTYKDEATNKEHGIQVYTVIENEKISFEAEVKTPERFIDRDENANVLHERVVDRLKKGRTLEWEPYFLVTSGKEGFPDDLFAPNGGRRYSGISFLVEGVEVAALSDGKTIWRGGQGKSHRFGPEAKPGLPKTGKTDRGMCCIIKDTAVNRVALLALYAKFTKVANGLLRTTNPASIEQALLVLALGTKDAQWEDLAREGNGSGNNHTAKSKEATCPSSESSSASLPASAPAPSA